MSIDSSGDTPSIRLSHEDRRFEPPADLAADANVKVEAYAGADSDREAFWAAAADRLDWGQKWDHPGQYAAGPGRRRGTGSGSRSPAYGSRAAAPT